MAEKYRAHGLEKIRAEASLLLGLLGEDRTEGHMWACPSAQWQARAGMPPSLTSCLGQLDNRAAQESRAEPGETLALSVPWVTVGVAVEWVGGPRNCFSLLPILALGPEYHNPPSSKPVCTLAGPNFASNVDPEPLGLKQNSTFKILSPKLCVWFSWSEGLGSQPRPVPVCEHVLEAPNILSKHRCAGMSEEEGAMLILTSWNKPCLPSRQLC